MQLLFYSLFLIFNWNFFVLPTSDLSVNTENKRIEITEKPQFKLTERSTPNSCKQGGCSFDRGYVSTRSTDWVVVAIFVQTKAGYWEKKEYTRQGAGFIDLKLSDCNYTGNYYAYACFQNDGTCSFPDTYKIEEMHKQKDQTPKFKVFKVNKLPCEGADIGAQAEKGYVYSPNGGQVEITLFMEKKDGSWRKKTYLFFGTGMIELDIQGCDLTGNYKATIRYAN